MKFTSKGNGTNRVSALKRLGQPTPMNSIHQRITPPTAPVITDARQLLSNRNKPVFDARQLLSRQSSKTLSPSVTMQDDDDEEDDDDIQQKPLSITRLADGRLTAGNVNRTAEKKKNIFSTEPISFTKTITNNDTNRQPDEKVVISFVNDQYRKRPKSPSPPPIIRRLNNASIQTTPKASSSSSLPIRTNTQRRALEEDDDEHYEPPTKRTTSSGPSTSKTSLKRTSTDTTASARAKPILSDANTVLITNLQSSVTEDDVIELFGEVGHINDIKTLSRGCVQIVYLKEEHAEQAVERFHNRLLDGQLMYVSRPQPVSYSTKSSKNSAAATQPSASTTTKNKSISSSSSSSNSNKITIDPSFIRQALFNPSDNTKNPVQFQVKL